VRTGHYGETALADVDFIYAASWPRAIHEGNGTVGVYISERASPAQRTAISEIAYGHAGGAGPFSVFQPTFRFILEPRFVPIEMHVDGKRSRFAVPGILEVALTPHIDPLLHSERDIRLNLPGGFIWTTAQAAKTAVMKILSSGLNFDHAGRNSFYTVVEYQGP
jgi:hypothetical protein